MQSADMDCCHRKVTLTKADQILHTILVAQMILLLLTLQLFCLSLSKIRSSAKSQFSSALN